MPLAPDAEVEGWRIVRHLATGGFGVLYEVVHATNRIRGALKLLHAHLLASPEMVQRLVREAKVISEVRHPSIVELLAAGIEDSGRPYLVMELLDGEDLSSVISRRGRLTPPHAADVLGHVANALHVAHERGVIHRDVKASNIVVCRDNRVVLVDFGIAKVLDASASDLTSSRQALGTPASMAPEQIQGKAVDARTDVYALGALFYHLVTGRLPYDDSSPTMSSYLHLHAARPKASVAAPVPPGVDSVIARAMSIDPARRYGDVLSFLAAARDAANSAVVAETSIELTCIRVVARRAEDILDDAMLDDGERVLPMAEAALARLGFAVGLDLGDSVLFVRPRVDDAVAIEAALAVAEELDRRDERDPRVRVLLAVHHAPAMMAGDRLCGGELLDLARWGVPETADGVWISTALSSADGGGPRRLREANTTRADIG
jgi:eukaryotic-like serine/threonine-protein kinase